MIKIKKKILLIIAFFLFFIIISNFKSTTTETYSNESDIQLVSKIYNLNLNNSDPNNSTFQSLISEQNLTDFSCNLTTIPRHSFLFNHSLNSDKDEFDYYLTKAYKTKKRTDCNISNHELKEICSSILDKDIDLCIQKSEKFNFTSSILCQVLITENLNNCEDISSPIDKRNCQDLFYIGQAVSKKSISTCNNISSHTLKYQCIDHINNSIENKNELLSSYCKDYNLFQNSLNGNFQCNNIQDINIKQECIDNSYILLAKKSKNISFCSNIHHSSIQSKCLIEMDNLLFSYSSKKNNNETCVNIFDSIHREKCFEWIKMNTNIFKISKNITQLESFSCNQFKLPIVKDTCYLELAKNTFHKNFCYNITKPDYRNSCLGFTTKNYNYCANISNSIYKNLCLKFSPE